MADRTETVILDVEIDADESIKSINDLTAANKELRKERNELNLRTEEGKKRAQEINAIIDKNTNTIKANSSSLEKQKFNVGNYTASIVEAHKQIQALEAENKKLETSLKAVDKSTEEGKKEFESINQAIQNNITQINVFNQTVNQTSGSVGKAGDSLKKLAPGLTGAASGFLGMARAALAFIATPIGAVIAALGLAIGALTKYFQGSEEGQNRLNKIVAVGSAIFEQFLNVVEFLGEAIFDAISNPQQALKDFGNLLKEQIVNRFVGFLELIPKLGRAIGLLFEGKFVEAGTVAADAVLKVTTGVEDATAKIGNLINETNELIQAGIDNGLKIAALQAKIDRDERKLVTDRAKFSLEVSKLREQAVIQEGETRKKTFEEAIALEDELSKREVQLAKTRQALAKLNVEANGDDKAALDELAEATARVSAAEQAAFDNTLRFRKELAKLDEEAAKAREERLADEAAIRRAENQIEVAPGEDPLIGAFQTRATIITDINKRMNDDLKKQNQKFAAEEAERAEKIAAFEIQVQRSKVAIIGNLIGSLANLAEEDSQARKVFASAQALINTYLAATAAYASGSEINVFFGVAAAAAAVAAGLNNVAKINNVEFAEGGWTGPGHRLKPAGIVHANEVVWNQEDVMAVGGPAKANAMRPTARYRNAISTGYMPGHLDGGIVANSISQPINDQMFLSNIMKNMPPPELGIVEFNRVAKRVKIKEQNSKR